MKPRTHEANQDVVCVLCLKKNNLRKISDQVRQLIKIDYLPDIDVKSWYYPKQICSRCSFSLCNKKETIEVHRYKNFQRVSTRSEVICECDVCVAARVTLQNLCSLKKKAKKRGRPSATDVEDKKARTAKFCTACFTEICKGKRHECTRIERKKNLLQFLQDGHPRSGDAVVAEYLRENRSDDGSISLSNSNGRPSSWTNVPTTSLNNKKRLTMDDMCLIKGVCDLSTRKTLRLSSVLRGMDIAVPLNFPEKLTDSNQKLKAFFSVAHLSFNLDKEYKDKDMVTKPVIYCNDVKGLIEFALEERSITQTDVFYKIGADGGGGSFKITLSIVDKLRPTPKGEKDTGVKKLFLLAVVPNIPEKYCNIVKIWNNLLHLNELESVVAGDLKMVNILLGLMGHSSTYPCPYCRTCKQKLSEECVESRTLDSINSNYEKWRDDGSDDKRAKYFYNCVQKPLLCGVPSQKTVMLCPPPVLHILLGIVNAIYKGVESVDPVVAEQWVKVSSCQRHSKYGFTGRNCHKLMEKRSILPYDGPLGVFRTVLDNFADVFAACLQEKLVDGYEKKLEEFATNWLKAGLPNSSKFHILRYHVPEFCKAVGTGLGRYGEQASETVHFDFGLTWQKLKAPESSEQYDDRLLRSVILYNSAHL